MYVCMYVCTSYTCLLIIMHFDDSVSLARRAKEIVSYGQENGNEITLTYPEILAAIQADLNFLLSKYPTTLEQDMEILLAAGSGVTPFVDGRSGKDVTVVDAMDMLPSGAVLRGQLKASLFQRMEKKKLLLAALAVLLGCRLEQISISNANI